MGNMWTVPGEVLRVVDGDTVAIRLSLGWHIYTDKNCRVLGVNAPELGTVPGAAAKAWAIAALPVTSAVTFVSHELDKYGRPLGQILYGQPGRLRDFGPDLIAAGHAVLYRG